MKEDEFDCTQDPNDFARRLGIRPQRIKEVNDAADKDLLVVDSSELQSAPVKENEVLVYLNSKIAATPPERVLYQKKPSVDGGTISVVQVPLQDIRVDDDPTKKKLSDAAARVQKAKDKAALDEAARRRSDRNKNKDEGQTMDKAAEMARRKNLEKTPGETSIPTVLNTVPSFIAHITSCIGVSLGRNDEEVEITISMIKGLEESRRDLYAARLRKSSGEKCDIESKLDSFDPEAIIKLISDSDSDSEEDEDLRDEIVLLSSLFKPKQKKTCTGAFSVKPKMRCSSSNENGR